jgi:hypothetical protein
MKIISRYFPGIIDRAAVSPEATNAKEYKALWRLIKESPADANTLKTFFFAVDKRLMEIKAQLPPTEIEIELILPPSETIGFRFRPTSIGDESRDQQISSLRPGHLVLSLSPNKTQDESAQIGDLRQLATDATVQTAARDSIQRFFNL